MTDQTKFAGEDENAGYASPQQDLIAAGVLVLLCVWVMAESLGMHNPGTLATAPGLLPFLTAGSLSLMALGLGYLAISRLRRGELATAPIETNHLRTIGLIIFVGLYLTALNLIKFDYQTPVAGFRVGYGSFEVLTALMLTGLLLVFWQPRLGRCLLVGVVWATLLAGAFRYVFVIPLPGAF